jgi:cell division protein FtsZ
VEEDYVAPRANKGHPTPETLARLRDAIAKDRGNAPRAATPAPEAEDQGNRSRFGINSLLNRMTGHGEEAPVPTQRRQPSMQSRAHHEEDQVDPEQDRIEIPAFLRRQAN